MRKKAARDVLSALAFFRVQWSVVSKCRGWAQKNYISLSQYKHLSIHFFMQKSIESK
jgi:hypothetical protein